MACPLLACPLLLLPSLLLAVQSVRVKCVADLDMEVVDNDMEDKIPANLTDEEDKIVVEHKDASQKIKDIAQMEKVVRDEVRKLFRSTLDSMKQANLEMDEILADWKKLKGILQMKMAADTVAVFVGIVGWILAIRLLLERWSPVKKQQSKQPQDEQMNILREEEVA